MDRKVFGAAKRVNPRRGTSPRVTTRPVDQACQSLTIGSQNGVHTTLAAASRLNSASAFWVLGATSAGIAGATSSLLMVAVWGLTSESSTAQPESLSEADHYSPAWAQGRTSQETIDGLIERRFRGFNR